VLFSRSVVDGKADLSQPQAASETALPVLAASITDAMRAAPVFTAYDFTIHLQPASAGLEAQVRVTIRNDGVIPLLALPLQLGSALHFEHIRQGGTEMPFAVHRIQSDADHTGALTEAAVALPVPLAPGASASFTIEYAGTISQSSQRLDRIGTPAALAARSDWDRIEDDFTGLRGFGSTVWYPVASVPAVLGDGAKLFHEIGRQKQRNSEAVVSMAITAEFASDAPNVCVLDGHAIALAEPASLPSASFPGVMRVVLPPAVLGFALPSIVLTTRVPTVTDPLISVAALPVHEDAVPAYIAAAGLLDPLFQDWFGSKPAAPLQLIDLPVEGASPAEDGSALLLSLAQGEPRHLAGELSGSLAHIYFHSPRAWLSEGVAGLIAALWTERTDGQARALQQLTGGGAALSLAEPASPGVSGGQPLIAAQDAIFYRTKAVYVLWMLRAIAGDDALRAALRAYDPVADTAPDYFEKLVERAIAQTPLPKTLLKTEGSDSQFATDTPVPTGLAPVPSAPKADLRRFFTDWVYNDPGLPDLAIANVFPSRVGAGDQWLVAVTVRNSGFAEAQVPVTVHSAIAIATVQVRVPAHGEMSHRILLNGEPTEVDVNDGSVPEVQASAHQRLLTSVPKQ